MGEHAFPLTGFVCWSAHVTFGGSSGIRSSTQVTDGSCLTHVFPRPSLGTRLLGGGSNVTAWSHKDINRYMQITNSVVCDASKGCIYKQIKPPLVGEHAFPLTGFVCWLAHVTME